MNLNDDRKLRAFLGRVEPYIRNGIDACVRKHLNQNVEGVTKHYFELFLGNKLSIEFGKSINDYGEELLDAVIAKVGDYIDIDMADADDPKGFTKNPIELLVALHGSFVMLWDETNNCFRFPSAEVDGKESINPIRFGDKVRYKKTILDEINRTFKTGYFLHVGEGSLGLSLRMGCGVCLRNTVRDTRGAVAREDMLMRNMSYIGFPVFSDENSSDGGQSAKPMFLVSVFFPLADAWHSHNVGCLSGKKLGYEPKDCCLFGKLQDDMRELGLRALELPCRFQEKLIYQKKVEQIAGLGDDSSSNAGDVEKRRTFLRTLSIRSDEQSNSEKRDILALHAGAIFEPVDELGNRDRWRRTAYFNMGPLLSAELSRKLPDLAASEGGNAHVRPWVPVYRYLNQTDGVGFESLSLDDEEEISLRLLLAAGQSLKSQDEFIQILKSFWLEIQTYANESADKLSVAYSGGKRTSHDKLGLFIVRQKMVESVLAYGAECIGKALVKDEVRVSQAFLSDEEACKKWAARLSDLRYRVEESKLAVWVASIVKKELRVGKTDYVLNKDRIVVDGKLKNIEGRIVYEFNNVPFTRKVFIRLIRAVVESASNENVRDGWVFVKTVADDVSNDKAMFILRSEVETFEDTGRTIIFDAGAFTALSSRRLLTGWMANVSSGIESLRFVDVKPLDLIAISIQPDKTLIELVLCNYESAKEKAFDPRKVEDKVSCAFERESPADSVSSSRSFCLHSSKMSANKKWFEDFLDAGLRGMKEQENQKISEELAGQIKQALQIFSERGCGERKNGECCVPVLTRMTDKIYTCASCSGTSCPNSIDNKNCAFLEKNAKMVLGQIVEHAYEGCLFNSEGVADIGLNVHSFFPIVPSGDFSPSAMMMVSSCQREYDFISRVSLSGTQLDLVHFASDYLESYIGLEKSKSELSARGRQFIHDSKNDWIQLPTETLKNPCVNSRVAKILDRHLADLACFDGKPERTFFVMSDHKALRLKIKDYLIDSWGMIGGSKSKIAQDKFHGQVPGVPRIIFGSLDLTYPFNLPEWTFQRVFMELVWNAIKYCEKPEPTKCPEITVEVSTSSHDQLEIYVCNKSGGPEASCGIRGTRGGISSCNAWLRANLQSAIVTFPQGIDLVKSKGTFVKVGFCFDVKCYMSLTTEKDVVK